MVAEYAFDLVNITINLNEALDEGGGMGDRGHKTQMFKGQGGHKTKTAKGHLTLDFLDSEGQGTPN